MSLGGLAKDAIQKLEQAKTVNKNIDLLVNVCGIAVQHIDQREKLSQHVFSLQKFLNSLETIIDPKVSENTWFDTMHFVPSNALFASDDLGSSYVVTQNINLTGRYLVTVDTKKVPTSSDEKKLLLIEESGRMQEGLTKAISGIKQVVKIKKKVFSIEGKGDLYKRQFTHFEFDLVLDLTK